MKFLDTILGSVRCGGCRRGVYKGGVAGGEGQVVRCDALGWLVVWPARHMIGKVWLWTCCGEEMTFDTRGEGMKKKKITNWIRQTIAKRKDLIVIAENACKRKHD